MMARLYRSVFQLSWVLGVLSIVAAFVVKFGRLEARATVTGRTLFIIAGTFFLCALASRAMER